jgi:hypothetical protein
VSDPSGCDKVDFNDLVSCTFADNNHKTYNSRIIIVTHLIPFDVYHIFEVTGELVPKY